MDNQLKDIRLNVGRKARETIKQLVEKKFMGFQKLSNTEKFLFAYAKGIMNNTTLPITDGKESLVRQVTVNPEHESLLVAQQISSVGTNSIFTDGIDLESAYKFADEHANFGFEYLAELMLEFDSEDALFSEFVKLDEYYNKVIE